MVLPKVVVIPRFGAVRACMSSCFESTIRDFERLGNVEQPYVHLINRCRSNLHLSLLGGSGEFPKLDVGERSKVLGFMLGIRGSVS